MSNFFYRKLTLKQALLLFCFSITSISSGYAMDVELEWDPNTQAGLDYYVVYWGTIKGTYTLNSGAIQKTQTTYTVTGLSAGTSYFFAARAFDPLGRPSDYSNVVSNFSITTPTNGFKVNSKNYDAITISGFALGNTLVEIRANGTKVHETIADNTGNWLKVVNFYTAGVPEGSVNLTVFSSNLLSSQVIGIYDKRVPKAASQLQVQ